MKIPYWTKFFRPQKACPKRPAGDEPESEHMGDPDASRLPATDMERVEGEVLPDFSIIGEPDVEPEKIVVPAKEQRPPDVKEKPNKDRLEKKEEKPPEKPEKPEEKKQEPAPEIKEEKKPEPEKKEPEKKDDPVPPDDKDLDALKVKDNAPPKIKTDFEALKASTKAAREVARKLEGEKLALEAKLKEIKPLDPKLEEELNALRAEVKVFRGTNDPGFKKEWDEKITAAEDGLFNFLKSHPLLKLSEESAKKIRETGLDRYSGAWWKTNILDKIPDPLVQQKVINLINKREEVKDASEAASKGIEADLAGYAARQEETNKTWWQNWSKKVEDWVVKAANGVEWASEKKAPEGATAEEKAAVENHNKMIAERSDKFAETVRKVAALDPETVSEVVFNSFKAGVLEEATNSTAKELKESRARVEELEAELAEYVSAGKTSRRGAAPAKENKGKSEGPQPGMTAEEAFEAAGI